MFKALFSFMMYHISSTCVMSQPQFRLSSPQVWEKTMFKALFSFIMYHISLTCVMSQPQFRLSSPQVWEKTMFKALFSFIMYVGPFPCLPFCSPKYFPTHSICCFFHRFPFLKSNMLPPPSLNICCRATWNRFSKLWNIHKQPQF